MLLLAVHNLREPASAKVPFSMVILLDCVSKKLHPETFRCRQILPTSGIKSSSLWEAPSAEELTTWLNELLESDCATEAFEVQEQFAIGLTELAATRVGEQLTASTRTAAGAATHKFDQLDERFKVSEQAGAVLKVARDQGQVAAGKVTDGWKRISSKAMENERVAATAAVTAQAAQNTATVFRGLGDKITTSLGQTGLGKWMAPAAASPGSPGVRPQPYQAPEVVASGSPTPAQAHADARTYAPAAPASAAVSRPVAPPSYEESTAPIGTDRSAPTPVLKPASEPAQPAKKLASAPQQTAPTLQATPSPSQDNYFSLGKRMIASATVDKRGGVDSNFDVGSTATFRHACEDGDDEGPVLVPSAAHTPSVELDAAASAAKSSS